MSKKDLNYIRHVKPQVHESQRRMSGVKQYNKNQKVIKDVERRCAESAAQHKEICQKAAKMDLHERLSMYNFSKDSTYLGNGCNWDWATRNCKRLKVGLLGLFEFR